MAKAKPEPDMVEELRVAIRASGRTLGDLAEASGVGKDQISRFLSRRRGITFVSAGLLCDALGITLNIPSELQNAPQDEPEEPPAPPPKQKPSAKKKPTPKKPQK